MKNYLCVFAADGTSAVGYTVFIGNTPQECQSQIDAFITYDPTYSALHGPTRVYYLMNKFRLGQILTSIPVALDPFHGSAWTFDAAEARNFGTESDLWPGIDQQDPAQVKATNIAEAVVGKTKVGHTNISIGLYLTLLLNTYTEIGDVRAASVVRNALQKFLSGKITGDQALALVSKLPSIS
jgi:hypothetical protein